MGHLRGSHLFVLVHGLCGWIHCLLQIEGAHWRRGPRLDGILWHHLEHVCRTLSVDLQYREQHCRAPPVFDCPALCDHRGYHLALGLCHISAHRVWRVPRWKVSYCTPSLSCEEDPETATRLFAMVS